MPKLYDHLEMHEGFEEFKGKTLLHSL